MKIKKIRIDKLYFQYKPDNFVRDLFPGKEEDMLRVDNSPHFKFAKLYQKIGKNILQEYKYTDYIKLMIAWGRDDKHNLWKVKRFVKTYDSIKSKGFKRHITVVKEPIHKKFFKKGYEISHGHHRAAICSSLGLTRISCQIKE